MRKLKYIFNLWIRPNLLLILITMSLLGGALAGNVQAQPLWPYLAGKIDHSFSPSLDLKPVGLTWDGEYFWVSDEINDTIYKIEPDDGSIILSFPSPGPRPFGLAWDGQYLWHADAQLDTIYKLDPVDGSVILSLPTPGQRNEVSYPIASLAWDGQHLWTPFYSRKGSFLYKIDPANGSIIESVSLSQTPSGLGGIFFCVPENLAWDEGALYLNASAECRIEGQESPLPWDDYILRYDPISRSFQVYVKSWSPSGLTFDGEHRIWFTDKQKNLICRLTTFEITQDHLTTDDFTGKGELQYYPTITLSALSDQVAHIYYKINDGEVKEGTVVSLNTNGEFSIRYWGVDTQGRIEYPYNIVFATVDVPPVDTTPPQVTYQETINVQADDYAQLDTESDPEQVAYLHLRNYMTITDDMDNYVRLTNIPQTPYPVGTTIVTFTATDDSGNTTSGSITVIVAENQDMEYSEDNYPVYYGSSSDQIITTDFGTPVIYYGPWRSAVSSYSKYSRTGGYDNYYNYGYLFSLDPSYSYLSPPFMDIPFSPIKTDPFISNNTLLLNSFNLLRLFNDRSVYSFFEQPVPYSVPIFSWEYMWYPGKKSTKTTTTTTNHDNNDTNDDDNTDKDSNNSLPHSMKGYELYSWPVDSDWCFTLITGTNRLKSYQEITAAEDIISEEGWVKITARGLDSIKEILRRVPKEEEIFWIGGSLLEQVQGGAGNLALPDQGIIDDLRMYAKELGLLI